ncbi:about the patent is no further information available [Colletotrichum higginsianum]|uniref:WW domain-containing oxidoreductase n=1 Tax=Colletotrichum higginsianum TaxID=80884 RepID=A0A4T0VGI8_9PEZI|nr:WW domain-containing oxidoreductase [Colletotrichum higginsianum]GJD01355.1 about the patent is no further information available [Colletotrichum higginsianum]
MIPVQLNRYTEAHKPENLRGPGDGRPTALQIVQDEGLVGKLAGRVALVTGVSSGLGAETLKALAATGATVFGTARDLDKARATLGDLSNAANVRLLKMDLASLASVREAAAEFSAQSDTLNLLVCNAGILQLDENARTADGFEMHLGVNHFAHFLLFDLLKDIIVKSSTPGANSRVVTVTSSGHKIQGIRWDNMALEGEYDASKAYGQSKTANLLMAVGVDRRFEGVHGYSVHPGMALTGLQVEVQEQMEAMKQNDDTYRNFKSADQCAATTVLAALSRELEGKGPLYLEDCEVKGETKENLGWGGEGYARWAWDKEEDDKLWELSSKLVALK